MKKTNLALWKMSIFTTIIGIFTMGCGNSGTEMEIDSCTILANDITVDTTLEDSCYNVVGNINVPSATLLTIKEGTTLFFQEGTQLKVNGALRAVGEFATLEDNGSIKTPSKPIRFTAVHPINGYWDGIYIYDSNDPRNELNNIIIEYAGGNNVAALNVDGTSRLNIKNSTIQYSGSDGFAIGSNNIIEEFTKITSKENDGFAGSIYANSLYALDKSSIFTDNVAGDYIIVKGETINKNQSWKALNVPTVITRDIHISRGTMLTIEPGATILFDASTQLRVEGALKAIGTAEQPIILSGKQKIVGYWDGIYLDKASDDQNRISHVVLEYAGGDSDYNGAIYTSGNSYINITDTTIRYNKNNGFVLGSNTEIKQFKRVTSTNNEGAAGILHTNSLHAIDNSSNFSENLGSEYLIVKGNSIVEDQTWSPLNVPVLIEGSFTVEPEVKLTIKAGSQFTFDSGVLMRVDGSLISKGTESDPIIFSALQQTAGYWAGIYFYNSEERKNEMTYTNVEYAGGGYRNAAIYLGGESLLKISNSTITDSASYGIYLEYDSAKRVDGQTLVRKNNFHNNNNDDVYEETRRSQSSFYY